MNSDPSAFQFVLIIIGIPIVIVAVVALLVLAPGWTRAGRYRPGDSWDHEPVMVGSVGSEPLPALEGQATARAAISSSAADSAADETSEDSSNLGGISVRW